MDSVKQKTLEESFDRIVNVGFCIHPYEDLSEIIDANLVAFGTAIDEKILSFEDVDSLFKSQFEQMGTRKPELARKRLAKRVSADENSAFIIEELTLTISSPEEVNTIFLRISCVMEFRENQWKVTHWHSSTPVDTENDPWHLKEWQREKEKLEQKVAEQTASLQEKNRELKIEAALERVRARTMAMKTSDELAEAASLLFQEVRDLGFETYSSGFNIWDEANNSIISWMSNPSGELNPPFELPISGYDQHEQIYEAWNNDKSFLEDDLKGERWDKHIQFLKSFPLLAEAIFKSEKAGIRTPDRQVHNIVFFSYGYLLFITLKPIPQSKELFERFGKVFEQTYTRFLDLQKAEAQAREAKIEAALERVRSRSLAMHHSSELSSVVDTLLKEFTNLEFSLTFCIINLINEQDKSNTVWAANPETGKDPESYYMKFEEYPFHHAMWDAWKARKKRFIYTIKGEEKKIYDEYLYSETEFRRFPEHIQEANKALSRYVAGFTFFKHSGLQTVSENNISESDLAILERFGRVFEQAYTRFLDLQKAEAQTREAQIELSLERIRAQVTAMQESSDLLDIVVTMRTEFVSLGYKAHYFWHMQWLPDRYEKAMTSGDGSRIGMVMSLPRHIHGDIKLVADWEQSDEPALVLAMDTDTAVDYVGKMISLGDFEQVDPQAPSLDDVRHLGGLTFVMARTTHGEIGFSLPGQVPDPPQEATNTLVRFAGVFDLAYKRFLDLKKAEAQAREAQINLAVERVRARALAMFKSEEILEVVHKLKEEIMGLNIPNVSAATIHLQEPDNIYRVWDLTSLDMEDEKLHLPLDIRYRLEDTHPDFYMRKIWQTDSDYFIVIQEDSDFQHTLQWLRDNDHSDHADEAEAFFKSTQIEKAYHPTVPLKNGRMSIDLLDTPTPEVEYILKKMGGAFDLAYKRFEDLKKAEKQARESEIELALERVRARTMAMQHSDELIDASRLLDEQVRKLGIETWGCAFHIYEEDGAIEWFSSKAGILQEYRLPRENIFKRYYEAGQQGLELYVEEFSGRKCEEHYEYLCTLPGVGDALKKVKEAGGTFPKRQIDHVAFFKYGHVLFITLDQAPEAHETFKRFATVFEQTYTRFLDLKKAEKQAYESKVEASLERVRGMAAAMNHSDDLMQIAEEMFKEMEILHINPLRYGIGMIDGKAKEAELWASTVNDGHYLDMLGTISLTWHPMLLQAFEAWEAQHEEVIYKLEGKERSYYYQKIGEINPEIPDLAVLQDPESKIVQYCSFFPFKSGALYAFTRDEPSEEGKSILKRFANVFEQAYIRYHDLQKTERQAKMIKAERDRLEIALNELEATQNQLIQREKLASLGQLTAGIAHEIKNPLNFVNNFSEVSIELIEEAREELNGRVEANDKLLAGILDDIEANIRKIFEHGSRADGIVKSMLQHSRSGTGLMEPTNLNDLIKEFVNLSFHGMRAGNHPINVDIVFDLDETIEELPLVAEEFSRVILNLCNNAFDAMREKQAAGSKIQDSGGYVPKLTVRTKLLDTRISIEIEDNGPGIPEELKDKILQPFFTTKKGTEGTGLGLSITNDIIQAHGSTLEIESKKHTFTKFIINIPT